MSQESGKGLRSSELNLRVIVGKDNDEYLYHAVALATQSTYIDVMLVSPMKEATEGVIRFPDMAPDTWETMMMFLRPSEARKMTAKDAAMLAVEYDKYDFVEGRKCCDVVLAELFTKVMIDADSDKPPDNLDALVDAYILAHQAHLPITKEAGKKYLVKTLADVTGPWGRTMFSEFMLKRIAPFVVEDGLLPQESNGWDTANALMPSSAKIFLENAMVSVYEAELSETVLVVSGTGDDAIDGKYFPNGGQLFSRAGKRLCSFSLDEFGEVVIEPYIKKESDHWVLGASVVLGRTDITIWKRPYSNNWHVVPPRTGWELQQSSKCLRSNFKIRYNS